MWKMEKQGCGKWRNRDVESGAVDSYVRGSVLSNADNLLDLGVNGRQKDLF